MTMHDESCFASASLCWDECVRAQAGGQCSCVFSPGDCGNQMVVLIRVCSSVA